MNNTISEVQDPQYLQHAVFNRGQPAIVSLLGNSITNVQELPAM